MISGKLGLNLQQYPRAPRCHLLPRDPCKAYEKSRRNLAAIDRTLNSWPAYGTMIGTASVTTSSL
jgi:hypothetical protein